MFSQMLVLTVGVCIVAILTNIPTDCFVSLNCFSFGGARHDGHQCIEPQNFKYIKYLLLHIKKYQLDFFILEKLEVRNEYPSAGRRNIAEFCTVNQYFTVRKDGGVGKFGVKDNGGAGIQFAIEQKGEGISGGLSSDFHIEGDTSGQRCGLG